jgi:xanthosine utilization system XapX-like protein
MKTTAFLASVGIGLSLWGAAEPESRLNAIDQPMDAVGFHCGNHEVSHFAADSEAVRRQTEQHGCTGWKVVTIASMTGGHVIDSEGEPVMGVSWRLLDADGAAVAEGRTSAEGAIFGPLPQGANLRAVIMRSGQSSITEIVRLEGADQFWIVVPGDPRREER